MHTCKKDPNRIRLVAAIAIVAALNSATAGPPSGKKPGLHIKQASTVNFRSSSYHVMTDSGGGRWDIQAYGSVYRGKSYCYSGGMYLQIGGTNFQASNYSGWTNKEGELELGPWSRSNLTIYRRIKAYKKHPVARWLEIIENPTSSAVTVQASIYTNVRYSVTRRKTSSGGQTFGAKDFAIWTKGSSSRGWPTLHVVTTPDAKIRPTVSISSSQIYTRYNLTIPPRKTVVLCHFESQNSSIDNLEKLMKKFPTKELLKDLPGSVRRMIVNMKAGGGVDGVDLERHDKSDRVLLANGDVMLGTVGNKSFKISALLGEMDLPAGDVLGMVAATDKGRVRFVLSDGQVIGASGSAIKLKLKLPSGGDLSIPGDKIKQWSYRVSAERPDNVEELGLYVALNSGDILALDASGDLKLGLKTACGLVEPSAGELMAIRRNKRKGAKEPYVASFANGSEMAGDFVGDKLTLPIKLGRKKVDVPKDKLVLMFFSDNDKPQSRPAQMLLNNGDRLLGAITDKGYRLKTDFGDIQVSLDRLRRLSFSKPKSDARLVAAVEMINGSVLRGRLDKDEIGFKLGSRIQLAVPIGTMASVTRPEPVEDREDDPKDETAPPLLPPVPVIGPQVRPIAVPQRAIRLNQVMIDRD